MKLREFLKSIKQRFRQKFRDFSKEKVETKNLLYLEKIVILIILLIFALLALEFNKSLSYKKYERIEFKSAGVNLYANLYYPTKSLSFQDKNPLIIYCHGIGSKRDFDLRIPIEFTKRGFYVAALDYQGHGESGGTINNIIESTNTPALAQDCSRLLDKLKTLSFFSDVNESQIGLIGHSLGGMVVLMNQALNPDFKVTVAWAPLVNFNPPRFGLKWQGYEQYIPINLLNNSNSKNLLIIMHVKDEVLNYQDNALKAKELTNCSIFNITAPLLGGGHQLFSNKVLTSSIQWFESHFFNSVTVNGPIEISYIWNYILIFLNLVLLISIIFLLISYSAKFFRLNIRSNDIVLENDKSFSSKKKRIGKIIVILFSLTIFLLNWLIFSSIFGLIGIFYASLVYTGLFLLVKFSVYLIRLKLQKIKFSRKELENVIKEEFNINVLVYTTLCAWYFILVYLLFSFSYPFAFFWPSNIVNILIAFAIFPIYFSIEILFRKIFYPLLDFIKSDRTKAKIIIISAFVIYMILMALASNYLYLPSVLFTFGIFLIVTVKNTIIYEYTKRFSAVLVSSFVIIQLFFSAVISNVIGIGAFSSLF